MLDTLTIIVHLVCGLFSELHGVDYEKISPEVQYFLDQNQGAPVTKSHIKTLSHGVARMIHTGKGIGRG